MNKSKTDIRIETKFKLIEFLKAGSTKGMLEIDKCKDLLVEMNKSDKENKRFNKFLKVRKS